MNIFKATLAAAAVTIGCLGAELPAQAQSCSWCVTGPTSPYGSGSRYGGTTIVRPTPLGGARIHGPSGTTTISPTPLGGYRINY